MCLGQALIYITHEPFILYCENESILGIRRDKKELFDKYDSRLTGDILNTEVFKISAQNDKVVLHI